MAALVYSGGQVFAAELCGTAMMCVVGLGGIANAVLPGTKGHGIGFLGIAFCFGLGVFLPLQFLGHISGLINPAVALAAAVVGEITWSRCFVCIAAEMLGGFLGGFLVWLTYIPHFQPLEFVESTEDNICDCCDLEANGVAIIKQELSEPAHRYASAGTRDNSNVTTGRVQHEDFEHPMNSLWRVLQRKIKKTTACADIKKSSPNSSIDRLRQARAKSMKSACGPSVKQRIAEDQEVKLIVFCTRPSVAKHFWFYCFWAEAGLTFLLTYGAFAIINRGKLIPLEYAAERELYKSGIEPALIGLLVFALVLCGGGTTGPALNPARDLGPRIAHWLLPIPGKGTSEWWYSWVPVLAPCIGAILGALFNNVMKGIHPS
ncbi:hypothetical protein M758_11G053400 [Ceratodon purpureus]|uniref:Aquaporin n=1 Tax=Ceratodon purpureus TaxID=3225 RepID=A0A8T0GAS2_CERPU|nr:hypothetical protein KC19_11G055000 [Ceratodon purpureus]KAG0600686.1 hypothetical protein M758_11G053400 [Ceratodon purpureus]